GPARTFTPRRVRRGETRIGRGGSEDGSAGLTPGGERSENTAVIPMKDRFHVYVLTGQSNMAGRGKLPAQIPAPNPRILVLNKANEWAVAVDPLHSDKASAGVGLGI